MHVILTGATGFIGSAFLGAAQQRSMKIRAVFRCNEQARRFGDAKNPALVVPSIEADTDWSEALVGVDVVVHCAARVHVMHDASSDPLAEFYKVNVAGTLNLARQAALAGAKRFVFLSSIKVNGEKTQSGGPYSAHDVPAPEDAYGISKAEAEAGLRLLSLETGMEVVIIRPPLVYGPGVKGNFSSLMNWVSRGLPLPFGSATTNRRSFVGLDNLVDLILTCVDHPEAANQTLLVSDGEDLSTADLLRRIGKSLNRPARLIPVPVNILIIASRLLGKSSIAQRLLGSLQIDISNTCTLLNWKPPVSVDEGLRRAVQQRL
ncbi:UDP-glucose 4-epimerase family protein [Rhodoferax bucti]|uniref:UDP-glucose 4-epimerase family protein n=1 Tax=Rhodoferax bucti TaxID=2576305 RepID=UPI001108C4D2|nr:SDR family oxidoreductase [Rhodoferax bucti]